MSETLLEVKNLKKHFPVTRGFFKRTIGNVKAVDNISFTINKGETLGLVGESGCGKTTAGRCILKLIKPTSGEVYFKGTDFLALKGNELRKKRRNIQAIFQDPYSSLNPRKMVSDIVGESLVSHGIIKKSEVNKRVVELLDKVGLNKTYINRYPHEFSGGQRQRLGIARALALNPSLIICDEPVSALDVSVQAQVINLLIKLQDELNLSYLFIAHDLSVVKHISKRIAVMYLGKIVELASSDQLFKNPHHPYTKALLEAVPIPDPEKANRRRIIDGDAMLGRPPQGCPFHPRCPEASDACVEIEPMDVEIDTNHFVNCLKFNK